MKILHGTWIPDQSGDFFQGGNFYIWVELTETKEIATAKRKSSRQKANSEQLAPKHSASLFEPELKAFLFNDLGIKDELLQEVKNRYGYASDKKAIFPKYFLLPTSDERPLPSIESARYLEVEIPETFDLQHWQIYCYQVTTSARLT